MNCLLGETSVKMQVDYLGTCLTGKAQEWFYRNVEHFDCQVCEWTLEMVCNIFTLLSKFSLITIELEPDVLINGVLYDSCDGL